MRTEPEVRAALDKLETAWNDLMKRVPGDYEAGIYRALGWVLGKFDNVFEDVDL